MGIEHPDITAIRTYGYPDDQRGLEMEDSLGNMIYEGNEYYELDGETYLAEELLSESRKILENHGAIKYTL